MTPASDRLSNASFDAKPEYSVPPPSPLPTKGQFAFLFFLFKSTVGADDAGGRGEAAGPPLAPGGGSCRWRFGCEGHCLGLSAPAPRPREAHPCGSHVPPVTAPSLVGWTVTLWPALFSAPRSVVRRAASLLSKVVDSLAPSITNVLVQGKQVSVCSHPPVTVTVTVAVMDVPRQDPCLPV